MSVLAVGSLIPLPASLGRSLRLGPFPSGRAAAKFAGYTAVALVVATLGAPVLGLPLVGAGLVLTAYAPDGQPLDARLVRFVQWRRRRLARRSARPGPRRRADRLARLPDGRTVAALVTGGVPVAFLPPHAAQRLFEEYRTVLQGLDAGVFLRASVERISDRPFRLPSPSPPVDAGEAGARAGYDELVRLLCRRRQRRVVDLFLFASDSSPDAVVRLERRLHALTEALRGLGLTPERRVGRSLRRAVQRAGWIGGAA